jgi:hypothetical protein
VITARVPENSETAEGAVVWSPTLGLRGHNQTLIKVTYCWKSQTITRNKCTYRKGL